MVRTTHWLACFLTAVVPALALSAPAAADPVYTNGSAQSVIDQLEADGYNVVINWLTGYNTKSLAVCWVTGINNPGGEDPASGEFVTVYVDVSCPNHDYD